MRESLELPRSNNIITRPAHYIEGREIEPIIIIEQYGLCHHLACVVKYLSRAGRKTSAINDLLKAHWYLNRELQRCREDFNPCLSLLSTKPAFSIQEILEDWKLSDHLEAVLSYILATRLEIEEDYSHKNNKNYVVSLSKALSLLQLAISECEQRGSISAI